MLICSAPSYNVDADVPMTEADLTPLLSKPSPESKKDKKEKKEKKEKKRSRKEMEDEEDEVEDKVVEQTKTNGVEESPATKKEKSKSKKEKVLRSYLSKLTPGREEETEDRGGGERSQRGH